MKMETETPTRRTSRRTSTALPGALLVVTALLCAFMLLRHDLASLVVVQAPAPPPPVQINVFVNVPEAQMDDSQTSLVGPDDQDESSDGPTSLGYPIEVFARGNRTIFAMESLHNGMLFVVALGKDGQLWHSYQELPSAKWKDWAPLTSFCPNATDARRLCKFDADPNIGKNADGRLEIFARFEENLDLWQMHQTDPNDPTSWSHPREGSCVDQDQDTSIWHCLEPGMPDVQTTASYWIIDSPVFPTSDISVLRNETSGKLQVYFRNFEGHLYMVEQIEAGASDQYTVPRVIAPELIFI
ncbi:Hypothetical Protein FCC1311_081382 [Hondaea fermentalgiana]|uniref:PLL-like beta propeller domain-containing protein n=1 Tax=Hondaea fermentalgiana TaxID=2315210 RepID=A0A2R5GTD4_9STRA|nr:Hypothetical Protein FCC1311_081382 [Hondaea fermentalgiana]|eukprot:GBG31913.1 Hypothetical Protein FCC1311_081382 [Hondaea fermentalgiana]